jgi:hypothetical protein
VGTCLALVLTALPAWAASPREELLRLVPEDTGFCLVVQDLRSHSASLLASPFVKELSASPIGQALRSSDDLKKLEKADADLQSFLGIDPARLRDDILGDAFVFAYRPGPQDQPGSDQGLVLLWARDDKLLAELVARLNDMQTKPAGLKDVQPRVHQKVTYYCREDAKGTNFYWQRGSLLVITAQEEVLRQTIDRDRQAPTGKAPAITEQMRQLGADQALVALWVNPRVFDRDLESKAKAASTEVNSVAQTLLTYWKALDGVALFLNLDKEVELTLAVRARLEAMPPAARQFFTGASKPSELWSRFPPDALFAIAHRWDQPALVEMLADLLPGPVRADAKAKLENNLGAALGKNLAADILPCVGPDWGLCVTAPPAESKDWFPHIVAALRVQPGDKQPPVDQSLYNGLGVLATFLVVANNNQPDNASISLQTTRQDGVELKYLDGPKRFPPGLQPAFTLLDGYLVLGSSPPAIHRWHTASAAPLPEGAETPLLRLSFKDLRNYVQARREPLMASVADKNQISREEAQQRLDGLLAVLREVDRVEVTQRCQQGQVNLTLRVQTAQPLK